MREETGQAFGFIDYLTTFIKEDCITIKCDADLIDPNLSAIPRWILNNRGRTFGAINDTLSIFLIGREK